MSPPSVILVAEDNDDDFVLLRCAFESASLPHRLIGVHNGVEAIDYLYADEPFNDRSAYPFPDLMLLDLNMPILDGMEVLAAVKGESEFDCLPIVVFSSVDDPLIIHRALKLGATDFLVKPFTMEDRIEMARGLDMRWLKGKSRRAATGRAFNPWAVPSSLEEPLPPTENP